MSRLVQAIMKIVRDEAGILMLEAEVQKLTQEIYELRQRVDYASHVEFPVFLNKPYYLHNIELTNHCPMSCCMCPRPRHMTRPLGYMDINLFRHIIDQYKNDNPQAFNGGAGWTGTCLHHFGESLLHPHFDDAIAYAQGAGLGICLSFNPIVLSKQRAERLFKAKPSVLYACLDGYDDKSFERIRGLKGAYCDSVRNILTAFECREKFSPHTDLLLTIIDIPIYHEEITSVCDWWKRKYGIDVFRKKFTTWNSGDPQINALADAPLEIKEKSCEVFQTVTSVCTVPWTHLSIGFDGTVLPCCRDYNNLYPLGNASLTPLMQIWNNPEMQKLRKELRSGFVSNSLCSHCERTIHRS